MAEIGQDIVSRARTPFFTWYNKAHSHIHCHSSHEQRSHFSYVDPVVTSYITGLVEDEDEELEDIVTMTRGMLEDATVRDEELEAL